MRIKTFKQFIGESVKDYLKPKSEEEIEDALSKINYNIDYKKELKTGQEPKFVKDRKCPRCGSKLVVLPPDRVWCTSDRCTYGEMHIVGRGTADLETEKHSYKEISKNEGIEDLFSDDNMRAIKSWDTSKKVTQHTFDIKGPTRIVTTDDLDASRLKRLLNKYEIDFDYDDIIVESYKNTNNKLNSL